MPENLLISNKFLFLPTLLFMNTLSTKKNTGYLPNQFLKETFYSIAQSIPLLIGDEVSQEVSEKLLKLLPKELSKSKSERNCRMNPPRNCRRNFRKKNLEEALKPFPQNFS